MALQSSGPIKMSEIKAAVGSSSNSLRAYSVIAKAATGNSIFDTPDKLSDFYSYGGTTTTTSTTTTTTSTTTTFSPISFTSVVGSCILYEGTGRIVITISGGSGLYQYSYDGGVSYSSTTSLTTKTFDNLPDGNYTVKVKSVTDNIVYTYGTTISIDCPPVLQGSFTYSCDGNGSGTINITATGGSGNYKYRVAISGGSTVYDEYYHVVTGLLYNGLYNVYLTDTTYSYEIYLGNVQFACTTTTTTTTTAPVTITNSAVTCNGIVGSFTSTVTGGTGAYQYIAYADTEENVNALIQVSGGGRRNLYPNPYQWTDIPNGTWYIAAMDSDGVIGVQYVPVVVNCVTTTTTSTTTTTTTAAPTTTTTSTTSTTTTAAPRYRYLRYTYNSETCQTTSGPTSVWSYSNVGSGFYSTGDGNFYLSTSNHSDDTTQIFIGSNIGCTPTTTTTSTTTAAPTTTTTTTAAPTTTTTTTAAPATCTNYNFYILSAAEGGESFLGEYMTINYTQCNGDPGLFSTELTSGNLGTFVIQLCVQNGTIPTVYLGTYTEGSAC